MRKGACSQSHACTRINAQSAAVWLCGCVGAWRGVLPRPLCRAWSLAWWCVLSTWQLAASAGITRHSSHSSRASALPPPPTAAAATEPRAAAPLSMRATAVVGRLRPGQAAAQTRRQCGPMLATTLPASSRGSRHSSSSSCCCLSQAPRSARMPARQHSSRVMLSLSGQQPQQLLLPPVRRRWQQHHARCMQDRCSRRWRCLLCWRGCVTPASQRQQPRTSWAACWRQQGCRAWWGRRRQLLATRRALMRWSWGDDCGRLRPRVHACTPSVCKLRERQ